MQYIYSIWSQYSIHNKRFNIKTSDIKTLNPRKQVILYIIDWWAAKKKLKHQKRQKVKPSSNFIDTIVLEKTYIDIF